jgi:hypothetical protein
MRNIEAFQQLDVFFAETLALMIPLLTLNAPDMPLPRSSPQFEYR